VHALPRVFRDFEFREKDLLPDLPVDDADVMLN
jgi:hypothetical protein